VPFLTQPIARLAAIIEGVYPSTPITGRSVPAGRHKPTLLHGDLRDPSFPAVHFHRGYALRVVSTRERDGDPPNVRAGAVRKVILVEVAIGYLTGRDAPRTVAGAGDALTEPTLLGHSDHEQIAEAFRWPGFWPGTSPSIVQIRPEGPVTTSDVVPLSRLVVTSTWAITLSYAPGTAWT
jgi:hypothetical protein